MIDCLFIGHNDLNFQEYEMMLRMMGAGSGAYKDLNLNFFNYQEEPYRAMDILNHFRPGKEDLHNCDYVWPSIAYLANFIVKGGYSFDFVNNFQVEKEELKRKLQNNQIRTVAITTTLYVSVKPIVDIINFVKKHNDQAKIIVGGPFIYSQSKQADENTLEYLLKSLGADIYVVSTEGEYALSQILASLQGEMPLDQVENIWYKKNGKLVKTKTSEEDNPLEENMIDWSIFPEEKITDFACISTSKSCPFACSFCGFPERRGAYTYMDVENLEKKLDAIKATNKINSLYFIDDTFNVPKERFKEIMQMMIKNDYGFKWHSNFRCQFVDEETVALMKESGCEGVFLGIESGSPQILKNMNKAATIDKYKLGLALLNKYGITSHASFIFGFPGETEETIQESIDFIEEHQPTFYRTQLWYCDPMTPIWKEKDKYGIKGSMFEWSHNTMTSKEATAYVDQAFKSIKNSIWLPQNSFEIFSLFYLQRKGMKFEDIREFVQLFNTLVKNKLEDIHEKDEEILVRIKELAQF